MSDKSLSAGARKNHLLAGEAFVAEFKREPSSPSDCAWMNGYDAAQSSGEPSALLMNVKRAADAVVAHIGCHGEINSRHEKVLDLLEALNASGLPGELPHEPADEEASFGREPEPVAWMQTVPGSWDMHPRVSFVSGSDRQKRGLWMPLYANPSEPDPDDPNPCATALMDARELLKQHEPGGCECGEAIAPIIKQINVALSQIEEPTSPLTKVDQHGNG